MSKLADLSIALLLILAYVCCFSIAESYRRDRTEERHRKYLACVDTGEKPIICSFNSVFKED